MWGDSYIFITCGEGRQQLSSKCVSLPQNAGNLVGLSIMTENRQLHNSTCEKLLGVFSDSILTFHSHIDNICKKAAHKLNA